MRILIFDTETSGVEPQWNTILQLSYQIVDSDTWATIKTVNHYFPWPENKARVSQEAISVNGLTEKVLSSKQLSDRKTALEEFVADKDSSDLLVAHNLEFDKKFIIAACREEGVNFASSGWSQSYDTMKRTTNYCQIPKEWGYGYKWPKLTELAQCLGIDYSHISLHDSSGDVELTKQCFKQLVAIGEYHFSKETGMTMTLHVESPDLIQFVVRDENGNPLSESALSLLKKKDINAARQELIKLWSEDNEEERRDLIKIYQKSPKIKTEEDFQAEIKALKPSQYQRKVFGEPEPTKSQIREELELKAKKELSSWKFWSLKKQRQEYVDARLESYYQQQTEAYNKKLAEHEESENTLEKEYNTQSLKSCEEKKQRLATLIEGNADIIEKEMLHVPVDMNMSFPCNVVAHLDGTTINIEVSLPHPNDLPQMEGVRLASGNYKIKEISDKNKKKDYSEWVWGIAFYVASYYFNVSPKILTTNILGQVSNIEGVEKLPLYTISFDRNTFSSLNMKDTDIETALSFFSSTNKLKKDVLTKLFVAEKGEPK